MRRGVHPAGPGRGRLVAPNTVYTLTYKWPGVTEHACSQLPGFFNLFMLNQQGNRGTVWQLLRPPASGARSRRRSA